MTIYKQIEKKKTYLIKSYHRKLRFFPKMEAKNERQENCRNVSRKNCQQNRKRLKNNEDENEDIKWLCERNCSPTERILR